MADLTAITTAFGLLDAGTRRELRDYTGVIQQYTSTGWMDRPRPEWDLKTAIFRAKPPEPVRRAGFVPVIYPTLVELRAAEGAGTEEIRVREVIQE